MERRLILAIALSLLVLLSWSALASKFYPIANKGVIKENLQGKPSLPVEISPAPKETEPSLSSLQEVVQEKFNLIFIEPRAAIKEVVFEDYQSAKFSLWEGLEIKNPDWVFQKELSSADQIVFVSRDKDKVMTKRFLFSKPNYTIGLEIKVQNLSATPLALKIPLVLGVLDFSGNQIEARYQDLTVATAEKTLHLNGRKDIVLEGAQFLGLRNRYFCAIIEPDQKNNYTAFIQRVNSQKSRVSLESAELVVPPGQEIAQKFRIYLGPQDLRIINAIRPEWAVVMHYGTFNFISQLLLQGLEVLYRLVHNWGWAIVLLSVSVYLLLFPLTLKQMHSMKEMQTLQPAIEELRKTYKDSPQRLNKEIMELYREHKVNPFGGCLPLVLQIPIFFALYQALMRSVALKGAAFLWIKDLSEPDRLFILPKTLPVIGNELNILPIVMAIGMFIQQKISLRSTAGSSAEQQRLMLILFPVMFGLIFYHMPSGLVLYWFVNSTLMLLYQWRLVRIK